MFYGPLISLCVSQPWPETRSHISIYIYMFLTVRHREGGENVCSCLNVITHNAVYQVERNLVSRYTGEKVEPIIVQWLNPIRGGNK
jgi:hypothetical protein